MGNGPSQGCGVYVEAGPAPLMPSVVGRFASPPALVCVHLLRAPWLQACEAGPTQTERCRESLSDHHPLSTIPTTWEGSVCIVRYFQLGI